MAQGLYRVQCIWSRISPASEDVAVIDFGWAFCNGAVDSAGFAAIGAIDDTSATLATPSSGDFDNLNDAYADFLDALAGTQYQEDSWTGLKVTRADSGHPVPNDPVAQYVFDIPGVHANSVAPQTAADVTLKVARRRSWGRFYVPNIDPSNCTDSGRWSDSLCDTLEAAYVSLAGAMAGFHWFPLVLTAYTPANPNPGSGHTITGVACDNVPDVIRRRRYAAATYRASDTIPP
jgi:hypothetical protein